jgi:arylsulfatase A-like enzyme
MSRVNRRDFLKLLSVLPGAMALSSLDPGRVSAGGQPNVIVLVFDAMSAGNLSLYGYHRETTPNFERFAGRANVYHAHYSGGNFTTPGTASLLTGMYPWTHRAINMGGLIARALSDHNIFRFFDTGHTRLAWSQNIWVNYFLNQFTPRIDRILSPAAFSTVSQVVGTNFGDPAAVRAYEDFLLHDGEPPASLLFGLAGRISLRRQVFQTPAEEYPNGLPRAGVYPIYFELEQVFDGIFSTIEKMQSPHLAYFHTWAPHAPYRPSKKFLEVFDDNWRPDRKPESRFSMGLSNSQLNTRRRNYDKYIANLDDEFGRLIDRLDQQGILDSSYVIVTSDHGEMQERGVDGHVTPLLYDPVVHIPLMVSVPGQQTRNDFFTPTNSVDILPTLLHLTGQPVPDWCEGFPLPGLGGVENAQRTSYVVEAKGNPAFAPITNATLAIRKGRHKLIHYLGYQGGDSFELFDLESDPEELNDLYPAGGPQAASLRDELLTRLEESNRRLKG